MLAGPPPCGLGLAQALWHLIWHLQAPRCTQGRLQRSAWGPTQVIGPQGPIQWDNPSTSRVMRWPDVLSH